MGLHDRGIVARQDLGILALQRPFAVVNYLPKVLVTIF